MKHRMYLLVASATLFGGMLACHEEVPLTARILECPGDFGNDVMVGVVIQLKGRGVSFRADLIDAIRTYWSVDGVAVEYLVNGDVLMLTALDPGLVTVTLTATAEDPGERSLPYPDPFVAQTECSFQAVESVFSEGASKTKL